MELKDAYEEYNRFKEVEDYNPEDEGTFPQRLDWLCRGLSGKERLLDYGCGEGVILGGVLARKKAAADSCGVDISENVVKKARVRFPGLNFQTLDKAGNSPFPDGSFDAITATEVIEHLFDTDRAFLEFKRVLKPGGKLFLTCPYHGFLKDLVMLFTGKMESHYHDPYSYHIRYYSTGSLKGVLLKHGFFITQVGGIGRIPFLWKSLAVCAEKRG